MQPNNDVLNIISENKSSYAFCFPIMLADPDILFFIRNKATRKLPLVSVQAKHYKVINKSTLIEGAASVRTRVWVNASLQESVSIY